MVLLKNTDCLADPDSACSLSQVVSGLALQIHTALLITSLPVPSHRMWVVYLKNADGLADPVTICPFFQHVSGLP